MMLIFDIGYIHSRNGEDLHKYLPHPHDGISFHEVKELIIERDHDVKHDNGGELWDKFYVISKIEAKQY